MKEFQIEQVWNDGCKGCLYFTVDDDDTHSNTLEEMAQRKCQRDWDMVNPNLYFSAPRPCRPTVYVAEYKDGKKVKDGIRFKTKWR